MKKIFVMLLAAGLFIYTATTVNAGCCNCQSADCAKQESVQGNIIDAVRGKCHCSDCKCTCGDYSVCKKDCNCCKNGCTCGDCQKCTPKCNCCDKCNCGCKSGGKCSCGDPEKCCPDCSCGCNKSKKSKCKKGCKVK